MFGYILSALLFIGGGVTLHQTVKMQRAAKYWGATRTIGTPPANSRAVASYYVYRTKSFSPLIGESFFDPRLDVLLQGGPRSPFTGDNDWWRDAQRDGRLVVQIEKDVIKFVGYEKE